MTVKRTRKGTRLDLKMYAYRGAQGGIGLLGPWGHTLRTTDEVLEALRPMIDGWLEAAKNDERPTPKWGSGRER